MAETPAIPWTDLFHSTAPADFTIVLRAVIKNGRPFLFLPLPSSLAAHALSLYPAQSRPARWAKNLLRAAFRSRLPVPLEKTSFAFSTKEPFARFLAGLVNIPTRSFPEIAILAGNPRTEGRRFIILLFDAEQKPAFVVKAGIGDSARQLIRHEASFLHAALPGTPGLPPLRGSFDAGATPAFALDFIDGVSPSPEMWPSLGGLLSSWLNREKHIRVRETADWQALEKLQSGEPLFDRLSQKLADAAFHSTIVHGDLAPWNIKISPQSATWNVLDWERGDLIGIPGWDWFHYVIQSGILVEKLSAEELSGRIETLFNHSAFQNYAALAKIKGHERALIIGYLLHLIYVVRPSEGLETNQSLLALLAQRWLN